MYSIWGCCVRGDYWDDILRFVKNFLPPILFQQLKRFMGSNGLRFEGRFSSWDEARTYSTGYDAEGILEKVLASTLQVKNGEALFERDSVLFDEAQYDWPVVAGLMLAAASSGGELCVMDFGGALGSSYFQNQEFLKLLPDVRWAVIEQPHYVNAGRIHIQDDQLKFYKSIKECISENKPNVILLSSVIQYLRAPKEILEELLGLEVEYLIINRTPLTLKGDTFLTIQHVPGSIFSAKLPAWLFSENDLMGTLESANYAQVASFNNESPSSKSHLFKGFIFKKGPL